eukprot:jgi/Picsp_1/5894/NSC_03251-R1_ankyrin repeat protein
MLFCCKTNIFSITLSCRSCRQPRPKIVSAERTERYANKGETSEIMSGVEELFDAMDDGDAEYVRRHASQKRGAVQAKLLKYAIQHDQVSMVHLLLDIGVSADKGCRQDEEERLVPLHYALWPDHDKGLRKASQRLKDLGTESTDRALTIDMLKTLRKECDRVRALYPNHGRIVAELVRAGADVDSRNSDDETPLNLASKFGSVESIRILIDNGANIESLDREGDNALMVASVLGHAEVTLALLNGGADMHAESASGMTALMLAAAAENPDIISILVCNGANIESRGKTSQTPLLLASAMGKAKSVSTLIKNGANTEATNMGDGITALMLASICGHAEVIVALINGGGDIEKRRNDNVTSLMLAAALGHVEVLKVLLRHGANINAIDDNGYTALNYATDNGKHEAATLLEEYGSSNAHASSAIGHPVPSYYPPAQQIVLHAPPSAHKNSESSNQIPTDAGYAFVSATTLNIPNQS